ncbi:MAG: beta-galactosidase, partial [Candidatus Tagabacteria bacterium]
MSKKIIIFLGIFLAAVLIGSYFLIRSAPSREPKVFGATFSEPFTQELGLDWKKAYEEIFSDLGIKNVRIPVYWSEIEPKKGEWHFEDIDWQLAKAKEYDAKIILVIGRRVPRWPECFEPEWAKNLPEEEKKKLILKMSEEVVKRYKDNPVVWAWQVENEPFLPFGE